MKNFYDKLLLALAFLALLGGAALYALKSDGSVVQSTVENTQPADNPYQIIPIPDSVAKSASWPEPGAQSSGPLWIYDVFTPPKIFIGKDGNFTADPPVAPGPEDPFGIYLSKISRNPYRIQIQGFSGDRNKPEECVLFFFDEDRQIRFFIRPGQKNAEAEVEVLDFTIEREIDEKTNVVNVTAVATILDNRSGETIKLVDGERLYDADISVVLRSREDPEVVVELSVVEVPEAGVPFETPSGKYILLEINLEDQTVTVEKQATEEVEARTLTLSSEQISASEASPTTEKSTETPDDEVDLSNFFN